MIYPNDVQAYIHSWLNFKFCCEHRAKIAQCHINNKGWQKLKEYHLEKYLRDLENPYGFLFRIKFRHGNIYRQVHCMPRYYYKYAKQRQKELEEKSAKKYVTFPSWRNR